MYKSKVLTLAVGSVVMVLVMSGCTTPKPQAANPVSSSASSTAATTDPPKASSEAASQETQQKFAEGFKDVSVSTVTMPRGTKQTSTLMTSTSHDSTVSVAMKCDGGGTLDLALGDDNRKVTCDGSMITLPGVKAVKAGGTDTLVVGIKSTTQSTGLVGVGIVAPTS